MNPDTKRFLSIQIAWLAVSLAVSITLTTLFGIYTGHPIYGMIPAIGIFILMSYYMRKRTLARMGMGGGGFGSSFLGGGIGGQSKPVEFRCISCGLKHNRSSCPSCGSRMRKADF